MRNFESHMQITDHSAPRKTANVAEKTRFTGAAI
jgi:hypothetical protein